MATNNFLIVGASGLVGHYLWEMLPIGQRHGTYLHNGLPGLMQADICNEGQVANLMQRVQPSVVFLPAAMTSADACEQDVSRCWATNVLGTAKLVQVVRAHGAQLVYFSSDYVFDGKSGPYSEEDSPHPINKYGKAKLEAERIIQEELDNYLIVRLSGVYGWESRRKNFVIATIDKLNRGESMFLPEDQFGTPTYASDMADAVLTLVKRQEKGIFHVAGNVTISRYAFGCLVADCFNLDKTLLVPLPTTGLGQKATRPLLCGLKCEKVRTTVGRALVGPREGLRLMRDSAALCRESLGSVSKMGEQG